MDGWTDGRKTDRFYYSYLLFLCFPCVRVFQWLFVSLQLPRSLVPLLEDQDFLHLFNDFISLLAFKQRLCNEC